MEFNNETLEGDWGYSLGFSEQFRLSSAMSYESAAAPTGGVSEVSTVRLRRAGERSGRKGAIDKREASR